MSPSLLPRLAVLVTCADWRLHQPCVGLNARVCALLGADGVDFVCLPGPDGAMRADRAGEWAALVAQVRLLMGAHDPFALAVAAHHECAGHPVDAHAHDGDVRRTAARLKAETGFSGPIHAIMLVYRTDQDWDIEPVAVI